MRELVNLCRRLTVLAPGSEVQLQDLPSEITSATADAAQTTGSSSLDAVGQGAAATTAPWPAGRGAAASSRESLIRVALKRTQGHRQAAARLLGWGRNTLTRKLKELGMADDESLP